MKDFIIFLITSTSFFILAVFQSSFLPHMVGFPIIPNLVFILFMVTIFFQRYASRYWGFAYAIAAGIFIDFFSLSGNVTYIGPAIIGCLAAWGVVMVLNYLLQERKSGYLVTYFFVVFSASLAVYLVIFFGFHYVFTIQWTISIRQAVFVLISYEVAAITIFSIWRLFIKEDRQLSLL